MKVIEIAQAKSSLAEYVQEIAKEPVIVAKNGKPVAALMALKNADLETVSLSTNPEFIAIIEESRARQQSEGGTSSKEMRRKLGQS